AGHPVHREACPQARAGYRRAALSRRPLGSAPDAARPGTARSERAPGNPAEWNQPDGADMPGKPIRIGVLVNDVDTEMPAAATTVMARAAAKAGHTVYMMGVGDLTYQSEGPIAAVARLA